VLIVMAGLPGTGKSAVAEGLARAIGAPVISVDPIEAALWRAGIARDQPTGLAAYVVAEAIASSSLAVGQTVIVDAVNAAEPAREQWRALAGLHGLPLRFVETICSDTELHRSRLETRRRDIDGFREPTWDDVLRRREEYEGWTEERLVLDTCAPLGDCISDAVRYVSA
jgi:predicted kinase